MTAKLRELGPGLWAVDHPLRVGGLALGTRSSLARLPDGGLWIHSPGPLGTELRESIEKLGPVRALVAPNRLHHLFVAENARAFPEARVFGAPGVAAKQPGVRFDEPLGDAPPALWSGAIDQVLVRGVPRLEEVVFLHAATRTLLVTDLAFNVQRSRHFFTNLFMRANGGLGRFGPTRIFRLSILGDRAALRGSLERILAWDFDRVIVAHGDVVERGGKEAFRSAFAWV